MGIGDYDALSGESWQQLKHCIAQRVKSGVIRNELGQKEEKQGRIREERTNQK